jgi:hypothetical protein
VKIKTRYTGPRGFAGSKITAQFVDGEHNGRQMTVPYDHGARDPHLVAVEALIEKFGADTDGMEFFTEDAQGRRVYLQGTEISDLQVSAYLGAEYASYSHPWNRPDGPYGPPPAEL